MIKFIDRISQYVIEKKFNLNNLVIILPSQRAKKYLQRSLFQFHNKPLFSPKIITMDAWIKESSNRIVIDSTRLSFELFAVHNQIPSDLNKGLDDFLKWDKMVLSDFDEIDRHLLPSEDLFKNLKEIKDIENWSFGKDELSSRQVKYMEFWDLLPIYYSKLNESLDKKNQAYLGSIYKEVANNIELITQNSEDKIFLFAGFNALSPAEIKIINQLETRGKATILFDVDSYYYENENHEAGFFIRRAIQNLNLSGLEKINNLTSHTKNLRLINCAQPTGQAKMAATILNDEINFDEFSETLLLLGDEKLIIPILKNIPNKVKNANITLGLPLKNTVLKSWVELIFRIQESYSNEKSEVIYHKDFIRFIKHPFIQVITSADDNRKLLAIERKILAENWIYIRLKSLELGPELLATFKLCLKVWGKDYAINIEHFRNITGHLYERMQDDKNQLERSLLSNLDKSISKLQIILKEYNPTLNLKIFKSLFNQHWMSENLSYFGNPLEGLQIMGLLETRLLDFKNIIIVGFNEGSLPPTNAIQSTIPMDLRRFHHLPTPSDKERIFAHHFYRLLHHVENCWMTYSSANIGIGSSEPSRYIRQIKMELIKDNPNIKLKEHFYSIKDEEQNNALIQINKNEALINRLDQYFSKNTSASALKKYLECPLDFYYRYLLGFGEEDKVEEEIEASTLGSFIHDTLEELYRPYARKDKNEHVVKPSNRPILKSTIEEMLNKYSEKLEINFSKHFENDKKYAKIGKNFITLEIADYLTKRFLDKELESIENGTSENMFIESLESVFTRVCNVKINNQNKEIVLKGIIDRIDNYNGELRIIDYKSGKCVTDDLHIPKLSEKENNPVNHLMKVCQEKKYILQLLVYNYLYRGKYPTKPFPAKTGIISLINMSESPIYLENKLTDTFEELMVIFEKVFTRIVTDIFDISKQIEHNPGSQYCIYCR